MSLGRKSLAVSIIVFAATIGLAPAASATIHPLVESFDCANASAFANHPLGDVADPPGVTPNYGHHSETSTLRSVNVITDDLTDFSSPAVLGHKLDGECGQAKP